MKNKDKEELVRLFVKIPKSKKEMIQKVVEKTSYNTISDLIRAGIEKELNLQIYKDNLEVILQEISNCIDYKLDGFIKSQRKLTAKYLRTSAINTYLLGELLDKLLGDDMHKQFINMLTNARNKANYYISRDTENMTKKDLYDFYTIGEIYRNE